jgi:signal transduction histidine kinase
MVVTSLLVAVPVASALFATTGWLRTRDMTQALERFIRSQMTAAGRDHCEADPMLFFAGPSRRDLPPPPEPGDPNSDLPPPRRPLLDQHPFELFAYDDQFGPQHPAAPSMPREFRKALLDHAPLVVGKFQSRDGVGVQMAIATGWSPGPCAILLGQMRPAPGQTTGSLMLLIAMVTTVFVVAIVSAEPTLRRIQRLTQAVRHSAREEYGEIVPVSGRDEIGSLAFAFNEAGAEIRRKIVDVREREDALRRFVANTTHDIALPLTVLQGHLSDLERDASLPATAKTHVHASISEAHYLASLLGNLAAVARLRSANEPVGDGPVDLNALIDRVLARHRPVARTAQVELNFVVPETPVTLRGDVTFLEQAVNNLVDNAIQYNRPGGHVAVVLDRHDEHRFSLHVSDDGPGVADGDLKRLAVRRFRTDEARTRRPGGMGLGLEIVRDVAEKFGLSLAFPRPVGGGFEAELSGTAV